MGGLGGCEASRRAVGIQGGPGRGRCMAIRPWPAVSSDSESAADLQQQNRADIPNQLRQHWSPFVGKTRWLARTRKPRARASLGALRPAGHLAVRHEHGRLHHNLRPMMPRPKQWERECCTVCASLRQVKLSTAHGLGHGPALGDEPAPIPPS